MYAQITVALGIATIAATTSPAGLVATGFVAVTTGSGTMQIYAFDLDGGNERRLTDGQADHHYPSLSPDGKHLLYTGEEVGRAEIYGLDLSDPSAVPVAITRPPVIANSASWSPDGTSIVYSALLPGHKGYQVFKANPDGSGRIQLTDTKDSGNASPVFSPDGARIAYMNGREASLPGPDGAILTGVADRIWVMNADGSDPAPVTPGPRDAYPAWLDASTIVFARSFGPDKGSQIFSVALGGAETQLSPPGQFLVEPKPLPDGKAYGATQRTTSGLHLVTVARTDRAALTAPAPPGGTTFIISRISVPPHNGGVFTMAWILAPAPAIANAGGINTAVLAAAALVLMVLATLAAYWRRRI
jgi:Tol biopolymer transport system component